MFCAASEPLADVVALVRECDDLMAARWWARALQLPQLIVFADERVEVMADRLAVDSGVGGEVLRTADGEHVFERVDGVGSLDFRRVGFWSWLGVDEVDVVFDAAAGEGDVAGFLVEHVGTEYEGAVGGLSLCFVDGGGVGVADVAGVDVVGWDVEYCSSVGADPHRGWLHRCVRWWRTSRCGCRRADGCEAS